MKKLIPAIFFLLCFHYSGAQVVTRLVGSSPFQDSLWLLDTTSWQVQRRMGPTPSVGGSITGMNGLARNPISGNIYIICKQSAQTGRSLGKIDLYTGVVTIIGNLGDNFASITFTSDGKLYGATGNGATVPETLYQIDTATAAKRLVKTMGNGADGEIICANPDENNMLYHWSGNGTVVYEKLDTITGPYTPTNIPIIGTTNGETFGAIYIGNNTFITSNISSAFNRFATAGNVTPQFGANPDDLRGLAIINCSRATTAAATSFCTGSSTQLFAASGAVNYQWFLNGVSMAGETNDTLTVTQAGHYVCRFDDACGTDTTGTSFNIIENPLPVVTFNTSSTSFCAGGSANLEAFTVSGNYQWIANGVAIGSATNITHSTSVPGWFNMLCTDANGCSDTAAVGISVTMNPLPVVNLSASDTICSGDSANFIANAPAGTYQWYFNNSMINGATNSSYFANASGLYNMSCTDTNGCVDSAAVGVSLLVNALPVVNLGNDTADCTGIVLDAQNQGAAFLWNDNSVQQVLSVTSSGNYSVLVTDANGCSASDSVNVTIYGLPTVLLSTVGPQSVCIDDTTIILSGIPAGGSFSGPGVSGNTFDPSVAGLGTFTVNYSVTDANGCSGSDTLVMTVSVCVGMDEIAATGFNLYPNPASGTVQITLPEGVSTVVVFNAIGEQVSSVVLNAGTHSLDLNGLAAGLYFVRVAGEQGISSQRLIINQ